MADYSVLWSLKTLLVEEIYPNDMGLCRNDSKAADLVFNYVAASERLYHVRPDDTDDLANLRKNDAAERDFLRVEPLVGLRRQTIRKYISLIWGEEDLTSKLKFEMGEYYRPYTGLV